MDYKLVQQSSLLATTIWEQVDDISCKTTHTSKTQKQSNFTKRKVHTMEIGTVSFNNHLQSAIQQVIQTCRSLKEDTGVILPDDLIYQAVHFRLPEEYKDMLQQLQEHNNIVTRVKDGMSPSQYIPRELEAEDHTEDNSSVSQLSTALTDASKSSMETHTTATHGTTATIVRGMDALNINESS
jgi:hypothetical protein